MIKKIIKICVFILSVSCACSTFGLTCKGYSGEDAGTYAYETFYVNGSSKLGEHGTVECSIKVKYNLVTRQYYLMQVNVDEDFYNYCNAFRVERVDSDPSISQLITDYKVKITIHYSNGETGDNYTPYCQEMTIEF